MAKSIFAVFLLMAVVAINAKSTKNFLWYPTDKGTVVPAVLDSGRAFPQANENDVHFLLFTPSSRSGSGWELIVGDDGNLNNSPYMAGKPVKVVSHGFTSSGLEGPGPQLCNAYFDTNHDINCIIVDWEKIAAAPWYDQAAAGTKTVGSKTGRLLMFLMGARKLNSLDDVHCMGHSLGAHVCGYVGSTVGAGSLQRITAMDPALPLFGSKPDSDRIDPTDAKHVDVIHTAGGGLLDGGLAFTDPRGHVDFFPNAGLPPQTGCEGEMFGTCSHSRCYAYMEESIRKPSSFRACLCNSWQEFWLGSCDCSTTAHMGHAAENIPHGRYYLMTNGKSPFSQH